MSEEKINKIIRKCTIILFVAILFAWALFNFQTVGTIFDFFKRILTPFIIGTILAFFLNIPMTFFERKIRVKTKKGVEKPNKPVCIILSIVCIILVIVFVLALIVPELVKVGQILIDNVPLYEEQTGELMTGLQEKFPDLNIESIKNTVFSNIQSIKSGLKEQLPNMISSSFEILIGTINGIGNFFMGMAFAFLALMQKERIKRNSKKVLYTYLKKKRAEKVEKAIKIFISSFNNFIAAQCIMALILGILCLIGFVIFQVPYPVQMAVLVGFTSLIPIFGVFIGIFIGAIIILSVSQVKVLIFFLFTIIAWQICENFIKPKVVGKKIGISALWLFVATLLGAAIYGVLGMIFAVPIVNTIYIMVAERVEKTKIKDEE